MRGTTGSQKSTHQAVLADFVNKQRVEIGGLRIKIDAEQGWIIAGNLPPYAPSDVTFAKTLQALTKKALEGGLKEMQEVLDVSTKCAVQGHRESMEEGVRESLHDMMDDALDELMDNEDFQEGRCIRVEMSLMDEEPEEEEEEERVTEQNWWDILKECLEEPQQEKTSKAEISKAEAGNWTETYQGKDADGVTWSKSYHGTNSTPA